MNLYTIKMTLQKIYPRFFYRFLKKNQRRYFFKRNFGYSEEESLIQSYLAELKISEKNKYAIDIASQDGILGSQTLLLYKNGWKGLAVECDGYYFSVLADFYQSFEKVSLIKSKITPDNVLNLIEGSGCPKNFGFLSLDIDSFDFFILDKILSENRPSLICLEINETIPPPIKFTVNYSDDFVWEGVESNFQGQSISKAYELCLKYDYKIINLNYNNLFIVPSETNNFKGISPENAYENGYKLKKDRKNKFPWNKNMEIVFDLNEQEMLDFFIKKFKKYEGKYTIEL